MTAAFSGKFTFCCSSAWTSDMKIQFSTAQTLTVCISAVTSQPDYFGLLLPCHTELCVCACGCLHLYCNLVRTENHIILAGTDCNLEGGCGSCTVCRTQELLSSNMCNYNFLLPQSYNKTKLHTPTVAHSCLVQQSYTHYTGYWTEKHGTKKRKNVSCLRPNLCLRIPGLVLGKSLKTKKPQTGQNMQILHDIYNKNVRKEFVSQVS